MYGELARIEPTPVVALNRAVAVAMAYGPERGLALLDELAADGALRTSHLFHSARADLLGRVGRTGEAVEEYRRALRLAATAAERRFLGRRIATYTSPSKTQ